MREARATIPIAQAMQRHSGGWKQSVPEEMAPIGEPEAPRPREPVVDEPQGACPGDGASRSGT